MEQGSVSRSSAAGQFPARQESTKTEAVPSAMPMLVVKSSVVSPLKFPQSPGPARREGGPVCAPVLPHTLQKPLLLNPAQCKGPALRHPWEGQIELAWGPERWLCWVSMRLCWALLLRNPGWGQSSWADTGQMEEGLTSGLASELGPNSDIHLEHGPELDHQFQPEGGDHLDVGGGLPEDRDIA